MCHHVPLSSRTKQCNEEETFWEPWPWEPDEEARKPVRFRYVVCTARPHLGNHGVGVGSNNQKLALCVRKIQYILPQLRVPPSSPAAAAKGAAFRSFTQSTGRIERVRVMRVLGDARAVCTHQESDTVH